MLWSERDHHELHLYTTKAVPYMLVALKYLVQFMGQNWVNTAIKTKTDFMLSAPLLLLHFCGSLSLFLLVNILILCCFSCSLVDDQSLKVLHTQGWKTVLSELSHNRML
jgi:hypothetical protein